MLVLALVFGGWWADARADSLPEWVLHKPPNTPQAKFYLGRSNISSSDRNALREAMEDASEQAIKENFGFSIKVDAESHETMTEVKLSKRTREASEDARLVSFEPIEQLINPVPGGKVAYVLYKYPVEEILAEKRRLKAVLREKSGLGLVHETGDPRNKKLGSLEVRSDPIGAEVKVDHRSWGKTPVRIRGSLEAGEHLIDLIHPEYDPELNNPVIIVPGEIVKFEKTLKRREITLKIASNPKGALVSINGYTLTDQTPLEHVALLGDPLSITLSHPEVHSQTLQVKVTDGLELPEFNLIYKPAKLLVDSYPSGAEVYLDKKLVGKTGDSGGFDVQHGEHHLKLVLEGYEDHELDVEVKGGESKVIPTQVLTSISAAELRKMKERENRIREEQEEEYRRQRQKEADREHDERLQRLDTAHIKAIYPKSVYSFWFGYGSAPTGEPIREDDGFCCMQFGLGLEHRFYKTTYFRFGYAFAMGRDSEPTDPKSYEVSDPEFLSGNELSIGTGTYFEDNFRIGPEAGVVTSSRLKSQGDSTQTFIGVHLGFENVRLVKLGGKPTGVTLHLRQTSDSDAKPGRFQVILNAVFSWPPD